MNAEFFQGDAPCCISSTQFQGLLSMLFHSSKFLSSYLCNQIAKLAFLFHHKANATEILIHTINAKFLNTLIFIRMATYYHHNFVGLHILALILLKKC